MPYIVYVFTNLVNEKVYIGFTGRTLAARWEDHCKNAEDKNIDWAFQRAIRRYGNTAFISQILCVTKTKEEASAFEKLWILLFRSFDPKFGYNMTFGGEGGCPTEETRIKISAGVLTHNKLHPPKRGYSRGQALSEKISLAKRGKCSKRLAQHLSNLGKSNTGQKRPRQSALMKAVWLRKRLETKNAL